MQMITSGMPFPVAKFIAVAMVPGPPRISRLDCQSLYSAYGVTSVVSRTICLSLLLLSALANAVNDRYKLLLSMKHYYGDQVVKEVNFYGIAIDPDEMLDEEDQFKLTINGVEIDAVNDSTYLRLAELRRSFRDDTLSQGIQQLEPGRVMCKLGGPASGVILETLYLTYQDHRIIHDEMRPVYDRPLNCLYQPRYRPVNDRAREAARGVLETLRTISELSNYGLNQA